MEPRVKLFGHSVHQQLIPLPLGCFVTAVGIDIYAVIAGSPWLYVVSFYNLAIGIVAGLVAAIFGLLDWTKIPQNTRAQRIGAAHGIGNVVLVVLMAVAVAMRWNEPGRFAIAPALVVEVLALVLGAVTAWLGGELVSRLGIGVLPNAHPDAASSLKAHEYPTSTSGGTRPARF